MLERCHRLAALVALLCLGGSGIAAAQDRDLVLYGAGSLREAMTEMATLANALDALLRDGVRVGVSPARIDPLGDHTVELFKVADGLVPGAGEKLQARAVVLDNPPGTPPPRSGDYYLDALVDGRVAMAIVYCSGRARYAALKPETTVVALPAELQVGPQYGLAVMKEARPDAALLALTILSPEGQSILARNGFAPVGLPAER